MKKHIIVLIVTLIGLIGLSGIMNAHNVLYKITPIENNINLPKGINKIRPGNDLSKDSDIFLPNSNIDKDKFVYNKSWDETQKVSSTRDYKLPNQRERTTIFSTTFNYDEEEFKTKNTFRFIWTFDLSYLHAHMWQDWKWSPNTMDFSTYDHQSPKPGPNTIWDTNNRYTYQLGEVHSKNFGARSTGEGNWSVDGDDEKKPITLYVRYRNDHNKDQLNVSLIASADYQVHAGKHYPSLRDVNLELKLITQTSWSGEIPKDSNMYYELDKMNWNPYITMDNISLKYPLFQKGITYEDLSYIIRNNWFGDVIPWKYIDLVFYGPTNEFVWDESQENREVEYTHFDKIGVQTNEISYENLVIKNANQDNGPGRMWSVQNSILITNGISEIKPFSYKDAANTELSNYVNNYTNKFVNGNIFNKGIVNNNDDEIYDEYGLYTNADINFSIKEDVDDGKIQKVSRRINGSMKTISKNIENGVSSWNFDLQGIDDKPEILKTDYIEILWQDLSENGDGKLNTIKLPLVTQQVVSPLEINKPDNIYKTLKQNIDGKENISSGFGFVEVYEYDKKLLPELITKKARRYDLKEYLRVYIVDENGNLIEDANNVKMKHFDDRGYNVGEGTWNANPFTAAYNSTLPAGQFVFEQEDIVFGNKKRTFVHVPGPDDESDFEKPKDYKDMNNEDFNNEIYFEEWKFTIDETLKNYIKNDKSFLENYRLENLYNNVYENLTAQEQNSLMRVMVLENGEIPMPKLLEKDSDNSYYLIAVGVIGGLGFITIIGGLMYRFNSKKKRRKINQWQ